MPGASEVLKTVLKEMGRERKTKKKKRQAIKRKPKMFGL